MSEEQSPPRTPDGMVPIIGEASFTDGGRIYDPDLARRLASRLPPLVKPEDEA